MFRNASIKTKLQISFFLFGFLAVSVIGWEAYSRAESSLEERAFQQLTAIREIKKNQVEAYFRERSNLLRTVAGSQAVRSLMLDPQAGRASEYIDSFLDWMQVEALFLLEPGTGEVLYASDAANRHSGTPGNLRTSLESIHTPDSVLFTDFVRDGIVAPYAFAGCALFNGEGIEGILIVRFGIEALNKLMTQNEGWEEHGLGESGEVYLVGQDLLMRNDSRFLSQEPGKYFASLEDVGVPDSVVDAMKRANSTILLQRVETVAATYGVHGESSTRILKDYRGIQVLSSYAPVRFQNLRWAILAEMDTQEAFAQAHALREQLIFSGLVVLLLAAVLGLLLSRTLSKPILSLVETAKAYGKGDYEARPAIATKDEIGTLGATLHEMAGHILQHTSELEEEVAKRRKAQAELWESNAELQNLSSHIQAAREEERKNLARELHDELGQALTAMRMDIKQLHKRFEGAEGELRELLESMDESVSSTIQSVKRITAELRPGILDDLGLPAAIEWYASDVQKRSGLEVHTLVHTGGREVDSEMAISVYRIFQEAMTNVIRHAEATEVDVSFIIDAREVELTVRDNGVGIESTAVSDPKSYGLIGMRERAYAHGGKFYLQRGKSGGTTLSVSIPFTTPAQDKGTKE